MYKRSIVLFMCTAGIFTLMSDLLAAQQLYTVVSIGSLDEGVEIIKEYSEKALILLDIDNSVIIPEDCVLRDANMKEQKRFIESLYAQTDKDCLIESLFKNMRWQLVEHKWLDLLAILRQSASAICGFTARHLGKLEWQSFDGVEDDMHPCKAICAQDFERPFVVGDTHEDYTIRSLHQLGVYFDQLSIDFYRFKQGILFCDPLSKGDVLKQFLEKADLQFKTIVMIDDRDYNIESALQAVQEWNLQHAQTISFLGVHYVAVEHMDHTIDEDIVVQQLEHLTVHKEYLSEKEIKACCLSCG